MTLLIKNVQIVGEKDAFPERSDVFISGNKISAIGEFPNKKADDVIDGQGGYLSPGFIDVDTTSDHYLSLLRNPLQDDFLRQGVTTIIGGQCGSSLAPLLYGTLESIRKWADPSSINVNWHSVGEFFDVLERRRLGVNFGTFAGHSTIRRALLGDEIRELSENEIKVFSRVVQEAMKEGALGLSTGLEYVHSKKATNEELAALCGVVKKNGGVYATHIRHTGKGLHAAILEAVALSKESGISTIVSHFMPLTGSETEYRVALDVLESLPKKSAMYFDVYPFEGSIMPIYRFLPEWAKNGPLERMLENLHDETVGGRIEGWLPDINPYELIILEAQGADTLVGRTLADIMEFYGLRDVPGALRKVMEETRLRAVVQHRNVDGKLLKRALSHERSLIGSHAPSIGGGIPDRGFEKRVMRSPRSVSTFTSFLSRAEKEQLMTRDEAIRKITLTPAKLFGFEKRGLVKEGYYADVVVLNSSYEAQYVVVNGKVALRGGELTGERAGVIMKKR